MTLFHDSDLASPIELTNVDAGVAAGHSFGVSLTASAPFLAVGSYTEQVTR